MAHNTWKSSGTTLAVYDFLNYFCQMHTMTMYINCSPLCLLCLGDKVMVTILGDFDHFWATQKWRLTCRDLLWVQHTYINGSILSQHCRFFSPIFFGEYIFLNL
jgi:hypothetical protein